MRNRFLLAIFVHVLLTTFLAGTPTWAEDGLVDPYVVFTAHEKVYARCGPAGEFYRTDPLRLGQELDVYLETEDGWLGIRPPEGSFSWVPAGSVEADPSGRSGIVVDRRAVAWIGTHLGRARKYRWQVQLAEGERVTILGETERNSGDGPELWYRIVPPSGEFRWVHRSQIAESSEELVQMHRQIEDQRMVANEPEKLSTDDLEPFAHAQITAEPVDDAQRESIESEESIDVVAKQTPRASENPVPAAEAEDQPVGSGLARATFIEPKMSVDSTVQLRDIESDRGVVPPAENISADDSSWVTGTRLESVRPAAGIASVGSVGFQPASRGGLQETSPPALKPVDHRTAMQNEQMARQLSQRVVNADLNDLQLELSRQMAAGSSASVVEPIRRRAQMWIEQVSEPLERERARVLIERVQQYQRISRRRDGEPPVVSSTSHPAPAVVPTPTAQPFDREGYLVQVYSARPDSPPYALTNGSGQTLAYVSPVPGVNLRMHLNAKVGLLGELSYLTGLETPHFIAKRVVRISR